MTNVTVTLSTFEEEVRSVTLTNDEWMIVAQAMESFSSTYRSRQSEIIATYMTRGQLDQAQVEVDKMKDLLQRLDVLQASLL